MVEEGESEALRAFELLKKLRAANDVGETG